jgi:hypothetical protein
MKRLYAAAILCLFAAGAYAQSSGWNVPTEQKIRVFCSSEANQSRMKGDKRKAFLKSCPGKVPACVTKADEQKLSGMDYIHSVSECVKQ